MVCFINIYCKKNIVISGNTESHRDKSNNTKRYSDSGSIDLYNNAVLNKNYAKKGWLG